MEQVRICHPAWLSEIKMSVLVGLKALLQTFRHCYVAGPPAEANDLECSFMKVPNEAYS